MIIDAKDRLAGHPILDVRKLLRRGYSGPWGVELIRAVLGVDAQAAQTILNELAAQEYIEQDDSFRSHSLWRNTLKGNQLALATASKPVTRATAERKLAEFMERVHHVKDNPCFLYKVAKVIVFGSYLTQKELLGDIDIAIQLVPKEQDDEKLDELLQQRREEAMNKGRQFSNIVEEIYWPQQEVRLFLKARSKTISLHDASDPILEQCDYQIIYEDQT